MRSLRRPGVVLTVIATVIAGIIWVIVGWYFAGQIIAVPRPDSTVPDVTITGMTGTGQTRLLTLLTYSNDDAVDPVVAGLDLPDHGFIRLGNVIAAPSTILAVREATLVRGHWPALGDQVLSSAYGWPADPRLAVAPTASAVTVTSNAGPLHETMVPGKGTTWVIGVHGLGADDREVFGILHDAHTAGLPGIAIEYRGAVSGPASPDGHLHFGLTEWQDIQANVDYLRSTYGAQHFILSGFSLGGELIIQFLRNSPDRVDVTGLILDAPLIDLDATLRLRAHDRRFPGWLQDALLPVADTFSSWRAGLDFSKLDAVDWLAQQPAPILLFHGSLDTSVPIGPSEELARLDPRVLYQPCAAEHVRCWNVDPAAYDNAVLEFMRTHQR